MTGNELEFGVHLDSRPTGNIPLLVSALCYQSLRLGGGYLINISTHVLSVTTNNNQNSAFLNRRPGLDIWFLLKSSANDGEN